jgi:hypothetical protein
MKHTAFSHRKLSAPPIAWRAAEYEARRIIAEDTCDDRVSEDIFDIEDERAEVGIVVARISHDLD